MRHFCLVIAMAGALASGGCGQEQSQPPAAEPSSANPHDGYLGAVAHAQQSAVKGIDTASLNHQIQLFNAQEGRFPTDLNELITMHYLSALPTPPAHMRLNYDAAQGKVTVVQQ